MYVCYMYFVSSPGPTIPTRWPRSSACPSTRGTRRTSSGLDKSSPSEDAQRVTSSVAPGDAGRQHLKTCDVLKESYKKKVSAAFS